MFAVVLVEGVPVKPVFVCRVLDEESRKGDSNDALFAEVTVDADEYVPGSRSAVDGSVLLGTAGIEICTPAIGRRAETVSTIGSTSNKSLWADGHSPFDATLPSIHPPVAEHTISAYADCAWVAVADRIKHRLHSKVFAKFERFRLLLHRLSCRTILSGASAAASPDSAQVQSTCKWVLV